jgi:ATP-dependent DNA ligase
MLPVVPPMPPMLARLARELPRGDYLYEPKWDGFRCLCFRDGDHVDLRSRHDRPLARYFPELVEALRAVDRDEFVLDGEAVVLSPGGFDFSALMARLHPAASRVERLARETPAHFVGFDLLALGNEDMRPLRFETRRERLEELLANPPDRLRLTPMTDDPAVAEDWLERFQGAGIDGVVAKARDLRYLPGVRAMIKVKHERTADCVVAGFRLYADGSTLSSLLLGLYDDEGRLEHVGIASSFPRQRRDELLEELRSLIVPLEGHPWEHGFLLGGGALGRLKGAAGRWTPDMEREWIPVAPERVCEVAYAQLDGHRFRHPAKFRRWRPDRDPRSCTLDQLRTADERAIAEAIGVP